jgi:hypothetical protein
MQLSELQLSEQKWGWSISLEFQVPIRGQAVGRTIDRAQGVAEFLEATLGGDMDRKGVAALVSSGNAELLVDIYENEWLDAKSDPYRVEDARGRYELAKDVAAFANSTGGLILVGAKTKHTPEGDRIRKINECRLRDVPITNYRKIIESQIYPPVEGVAVSTIEGSTPETGVVLIEVPEQDDSNFSVSRFWDGGGRSSNRAWVHHREAGRRRNRGPEDRGGSCAAARWDRRSPWTRAGFSSQGPCVSPAAH